MDNRTHLISLFLSAVTFLASNVGCTTVPWRANKTAATVTAEQYAAQVVENIRYDKTIDFAHDYQPNQPNQASLAPASSYPSPPKVPSTAMSSTSGNCTSGCCH
jgi:hypothetical protein